MTLRFTGLSLLILALLSPTLRAQGEDEAYLRVREARDGVRDVESPAALARFESEAARYLAAFPEAPRCRVVEMWRGDLLREARPREALDAYRRSGEQEALLRAADLAFRHEAPPPLRVERWLGDAVDPSAADGEVKLLVFFSVTHPQTARLLPHLVHLHGRWEKQGLRMAGVASVVDDQKNQTPDKIAERLGQRPHSLPFPLAIDRQRAGLPTESLRLYRGSLVPWAVLIDRYGRIAWLDGIMLQPNALARFEKRIDEVLAEPRIDDLVQEAISGGPGALDKLTALRCLAGANGLAQVVASGKCARAEEAEQSLRTLLPKGADPAKLDWTKLRYDFAEDRLVAK